MLAFLNGCQKGLNGHFVSPVLNFSVGTEGQRLGLPDPRKDEVHPYCLTFHVANAKADADEVEKHLQETASFVVVERRRASLVIHLHTAHPGAVLEQIIGFGTLTEMRLNNMAEPHSMILAHLSLMPVALLAVARSEQHAERLQKCGANLIALGDEDDTPSVGALVNAAHSDFAESYVMVSDGPRLGLVLQQVKRILGDRVEILTVRSAAEQEAAVRSFDRNLTAQVNAERMRRGLTNK